MQSAYVIEIVTPKKVLLNGLWYGPRRARRAVIWIHGWNSSMFSKKSVMLRLARQGIGVLAFNNRGHDKVSYITTIGGKKIGRKGGGAHEVFTECVDDIQGAVNFARKNGAKEIYLVGHSTGCQKSIYWASKKGRGVRGIVLIAPVSDYAAEMKLSGRAVIARAAKVAKQLLARGKKHELLPESVRSWPNIVDAQRFLSLATPESVEEIFSYAIPKKRPTILKRVKIPILVLFPEKDEYIDRPAKDILKWFAATVRSKYSGALVRGATHGISGKEGYVASHIARFMKGR